MAVHLTETAITKGALTARETNRRLDLTDAKTPGLRLRVAPPNQRKNAGKEDGKRVWVLCCRDREGRMRRYPLGEYPTMGISAARTAAKALHVKVVHDGADPVAERRRERVIGRDAKDGIGTLGALLGMYEQQKGGKLKSWAECRRRIESVFAAQLKRPLETMKLADLQMTADKWASSQSAAAAVRYLRPILKWATHRRYVPADLATISPPATVGRRVRVLSREELAALLPTLAASNRPYAAAMRFLLLTLSRREEAASARWRDIDLHAATWTIRETKNGQPHVVPLSHLAVALLLERVPKDKNEKPTKPDAADLLFATATGEPLANWDRETKIIMEASGTDGWTRHDLRRTGATMLGEMGELPDIIEAALNHVAIRSQLAATYNRSRYRPQVAAALQRLADALDGIEAGAGRVVALHPLTG
jgi:integrase